jgi:hypothetical protein
LVKTKGERKRRSQWFSRRRLYSDLTVCVAPCILHSQLNHPSAVLDATPATGASTGIPLPDFVTNPQPTPTSKPKRDEPSSTTEPSVQSSSKTEGKNKGKAKADEVEDITKIREKHAKEKDSAAYVEPSPLYFPS